MYGTSVFWEMIQPYAEIEKCDKGKWRVKIIR